MQLCRGSVAQEAHGMKLVNAKRDIGGVVSRVRVLICGDVEGKFLNLSRNLEIVKAKQGPINFALCVGKFFRENCELVPDSDKVNDNGKQNLESVNCVAGQSSAESSEDTSGTNFEVSQNAINNSNCVDLIENVSENFCDPEMYFLLGQRQFPMKVYFIDSSFSVTGEHLRQNYVGGFKFHETLEFLGGFGFRDIDGLSVGFVSGQYNATHFFDESEDEENVIDILNGEDHNDALLSTDSAQNGGAICKDRDHGSCLIRLQYYAGLHKAYYCKSVLQTMKQLATEHLGETDIFLSCDWPASIENSLPSTQTKELLNLLQLGRISTESSVSSEKEVKKKNSSQDTSALSTSPAISEIVECIEPRYHVAGLSGVFYQRPPYRTSRLGLSARFIGLGKVSYGLKAMSEKRLRFLHVLQLKPIKLVSKDPYLAVPCSCTASPYFDLYNPSGNFVSERCCFADSMEYAPLKVLKQENGIVEDEAKPPLQCAGEHLRSTDRRSCQSDTDQDYLPLKRSVSESSFQCLKRSLVSSNDPYGNDGNQHETVNLKSPKTMILEEPDYNWTSLSPGKPSGLLSCYPKVSNENGFDLAHKIRRSLGNVCSTQDLGMRMKHPSSSGLSPENGRADWHSGRFSPYKNKKTKLDSQNESTYSPVQQLPLLKKLLDEHNKTFEQDKSNDFNISGASTVETAQETLGVPRTNFNEQLFCNREAVARMEPREKIPENSLGESLSSEMFLEPSDKINNSTRPDGSFKNRVVSDRNVLRRSGRSVFEVLEGIESMKKDGGAVNGCEKNEPANPSVFVSNIPYEVDEESFLGIMSSFGEIVHVSMPRISERRSCGKAWITYKSALDAGKAVAASEQLQSGGRLLKIQHAHLPLSVGWRANDSESLKNWGTDRSRYSRKGHGGFRKTGNSSSSVTVQAIDVRPHSECWFCLANPGCEKRLIIAIGDKVYLTLARGGMVKQHVLIIPATHYPNFVFCPPDVGSELEAYIAALRLCYKTQGMETVVYERYLPMKTTTGMHMQLQVIPVPAKYRKICNEVFEKKCSKTGFSSVRFSDGESLSTLRRKVKDHIQQPYFYVEFPGMGNDQVERRVFTFASNEFKISLHFGRELVGEILNVQNRINWKHCVEPEDVENELVQQMKELFSPFQPETLAPPG